MLSSKALALLPLALAGTALGHGQVRWFITSDTTYPAADAYASSPDPNSPIRKLNTYGPAAPFTGPDITCGPGGNLAAAVVAPVQAGSSVTFDWGQWTSSHAGPVMTYIAACPNGCASFKGDSGNVWVKIQQDGFNPTRTPNWAEQLIEQGGQQGHGKWTIQIPSQLPNGEYILRHEILGLHVAYQENGAQFYPNCVQIKITGGGSQSLPAGIALPGAYQPQDPGILVQLYTITPQNPTYTIPGGPIVYPTGGGGSSPSSSSSNKPSSSSTRSSSVPTSTPKPSSSSTSVSGGAPLYGQCGGQGWTGATTCASGTCKVSNPYYSQCLP